MYTGWMTRSLTVVASIHWTSVNTRSANPRDSLVTSFSFSPNRNRVSASSSCAEGKASRRTEHRRSIVSPGSFIA